MGEPPAFVPPPAPQLQRTTQPTAATATAAEKKRSGMAKKEAERGARRAEAKARAAAKMAAGKAAKEARVSAKVAAEISAANEAPAKAGPQPGHPEYMHPVVSI